MTSGDSSDFWSSLVQDSELLIQLNADRNIYDIDSKISRRSCLGTAVNLEADAVQLALTGFESEARKYFDLIRKLALAAYEGGETYIYKDSTGKALFAKYMAFRVAALAEWVSGGGRRGEYLSLMFKFFEQAIEEEAGASWEDFALDAALAGPLCLHAIQLGQPDLLRKIIFINSSSGKKWVPLLKIIIPIFGGERHIAGLDAKFEKWFIKHTDASHFRRPYDPSFTANDMVTIAEIRASAFFRTADPWTIIKSIRWPDVLPSVDRVHTS